MPPHPAAMIGTPTASPPKAAVEVEAAAVHKFVQHLHEILKNKFSTYANWHKSPRHSYYHWALFVSISLLVTIVLYNQIQQADFELAMLRVQAGTVVDVFPGSDIPNLVANNLPNTTFNIKAGLYRMQHIDPKDGDIFIGETGAILNGSRVLSSWACTAGTMPNCTGGIWFATGQTQQGVVHTAAPCNSGYPRCNYPEDVFIDNVPLTQTSTLGEVTSGKFYLDYVTHMIYVGDNPIGHTVEASVSPYAFAGNASNVTIQNIIIEKYATTPQFGAIGNQYPGTGWIVQNNDIRLNHGAGIHGSTNWKILNNKVHGNGQIGISGGGDDVLLQGNEIYNNGVYAGVNYLWEGGGTKFSGTNRLKVLNNYSHNNRGPGLWTDIDNINVLYDGNTSEYNYGTDASAPGIMHEVSYSAIIRNNIVRFNNKGYGMTYDQNGWPWAAQILISTSKDTDVYHNIVVADSTYSEDAITVIGQNNRDFTDNGKFYGHYESDNDHIYENMITVTGPGQGRTGLVGNVTNTTFNSNSYNVGNLSIGNWYWNQGLAWTTFKGSFAQEAGGCASTNNSCPDPTGITPPPTPTPPPVPQTPYAGVISVPGTVQAENFDNGGQGVAYNDSDTTNNGGQYRMSEGVDVKVSTDTGGGYAVGWMNAGEWLEYTVNVASAGNYDIAARVATPNTGKTLHIEFGGVDKTGAMAIPVTGNWDTTYSTVTASNVALTSGQQIMRIFADTDLFDLNYITITAHAALAGDLNLDHIVNSLDWSYMNSKWFTTDATADINHDGLVNAIDFSILNSHWFGTW